MINHFSGISSKKIKKRHFFMTGWRAGRLTGTAAYRRSQPIRK
jgi:hypothetical protein